MKNDKIKFNYKRDNGLTGKLLYHMYAVKKPSIRKIVIKLCYHFIGKHNQFYSRTLRNIFWKYHNVRIGMYSHGGCFIPYRMPRGTTVGRYCSIAVTATVLDANHPTDTKSTHAFFFNPSLGYVNDLTIPITKLRVGHDVWIGHNATILPSCKEIGSGAVIAAGSVVNKNVPDYTIFLGNPARVVRYRFSKEKIEELLNSKWWENDINKLRNNIDDFLAIF